MAAAQVADTGVLNTTQDTPVWCWAAVARQIIAWTNRGPAAQQCELVSIAGGLPPFACCQAAGHPLCMRTGGLHEIQGLIAVFGGRWSSLAPPGSPHDLYQVLSRGRPVILAVRTGLGGHVVVLRGIDMRSPDPVLLINDPMSFFPGTYYYSQLLPYWLAAIIVH